MNYYGALHAERGKEQRSVEVIVIFIPGKESEQLSIGGISVEAEMAKTLLIAKIQPVRGWNFSLQVFGVPDGYECETIESGAALTLRFEWGNDHSQNSLPVGNYRFKHF